MSSGGALFGRNGRHSQGPKSLVEFKAGKLNLRGNKMSADPRKGLVFVEIGDDELVHFKWKDRTKGDVEDDLIIFQDDVEYNRIKQCTDGRVFVLKLKSSNAKHFFWMQEPSAEKDEELWQKIVEVVKDPSQKSKSNTGSNLALTDLPGLEVSNLRDSELQNMLSHLTQQQLVHLFGPMRQRRSGASEIRPATQQSAGSSARESVASSSALTTSTSQTAPSKAPIQLGQLQDILSGLKVPPEAELSGTEGELSPSACLDVLQPLLDNPEFVTKMRALVPESPTSQDIDQESGNNSTEEREILDLFSTGFQAGHLAPLIREFELGEEAIQAATSGDLGAFIKALQKTEEVKKKEDMDLD